MFILSLILILAITTLIYFTYKLMILIRQNQYQDVLKFLSTYISVVFIGVIVLYFALMIMSIVEIGTHEYIFIMFIKLLIHMILFVSIFMTVKKLILNLKQNIIFDHNNATYIHDIGSKFIYMSIVEIVLGLFMGIITFITGSPSKDFMIHTNNTLILFILFGLILLLVSYILKKAIDIYEENQLTI